MAGRLADLGGWQILPVPVADPGQTMPTFVILCSYNLRHPKWIVTPCLAGGSP